MPDPWESDWTVLYFSPRDKWFLAIAEAKKGFAKVEIGEPVVIPDSEFERRVGDVLIGFLDQFRTTEYRPSDARRRTPQEHRDFIKKHLSVSVERTKSGEFAIRPMHHQGSGYVARTGEQILVRAEEIPGRIPSALRQAFALAT